jgi:hypothetical protein
MRRTKIFVLSIVLAAATLFLLCTQLGPVFAQKPAVQVQTVQVQKPALSENDALKNVRVEESVGVAAGILPDLTIKEMCLYGDPKTPDEGLRVQVANIGNKDADPFEVGIKFIYSGDDVGLWYVDKLAGLKVGEERWLEYRPMSGGGFTLAFVVAKTEKFQVIADPSYLKSYGPLGMYRYEVKSQITESNKRNNTLTISRAEMKRCDLKNIEKPIPKIQVVKPIRP